MTTRTRPERRAVEEVAILLRGLRLAQNLTQQEAADQMGRAVGVVAGWEQPGNPRLPKIGHVAGIAQVYGMGALELSQLLEFAAEIQEERDQGRKRTGPRRD